MSEQEAYERYTDTLDDLHIYVQPGGCVEISQLHDNQTEGDDPEQVHICHWHELLPKVARIMQRRHEDGAAL